jgi:hypothetical protein
MRQLDYGRDNRLRLWFLGHPNWKEIDANVSPNEAQFLAMMTSCLERWREILPKHAYCVLLLGDNRSRRYNQPLPDAVADIAVNIVGGYRCVLKHTDVIPRIRRVRRDYNGNSSETIVALRTR